MIHISADVPWLLVASVVYGTLLWIAVLFWVTRDAIHRTPSTGFHIFAILINLLLPVVGLFLYLLLRPEKSMLEVFHDELERRIFGERQLACSDCGGLNDENTKFCVFCGEKLMIPCKKCGKENTKKATFCSECGETMKESQ